MLTNWKRLSIASIGASILLLGMGVHAAHDDGNLRNLVVTVSSVSGGDVTIDISGTGYDSDDLPAMRLGAQFYYDASSPVGPGELLTWINPSVPPAIDWGDGNALDNTGIPFTGTTAIPTGTSPSSTATGRTFSGQFMHTYAAPGNYTIRVFGTNVYASCCGSPDSSGYMSSGTVSVNTPAYRSSVSSTGSYTRNTGLQPIGMQKSTAVSISSVGATGGATSVEPVPTLSTWAMVLLGLMLASFGLLTLRRA
jgi:hypothetical protein